MHIAMVAGEASGDILGAGLIRALKNKNPDIRFSGVGGPLMIAEGFESLFPMDRLSVMGIIEPLKRLPELLKIRKTIKQHCLINQVDAFIGIDSPDFNLNIERFLKLRDIKSIHYVSPSVWAWRKKRIFKIKKSVDMMLTLLPFENAIYEQHDIPVTFVGHPLADDIAIEQDKSMAKQTLGIQDDKLVIGIMPGSRSGEVSLLGQLFLDVGSRLSKKYPEAVFLLPAANMERKQQLETIVSGYPELNVKLLDGQSHKVMAAADALLIASGTTSLEAMLFKTPVVVSYKMAPLSFAIISRLVKTEYVSLPNLLANEMLVPELLQDDATVDALESAMLKAIEDKSYREACISRFTGLHQLLNKNASETAANAVMGIL